MTRAHREVINKNTYTQNTTTYKTPGAARHHDPPRVDRQRELGAAEGSGGRQFESST